MASIDFDEQALDKASEAMYLFYLGLAERGLEETEFDCSSMVEIFRRLRQDSETSQVIVASSYIEDRTAAILQCQMLYLDTETAKQRLFGNNGPLGTFGNRLAMAYHLGWLTKDTMTAVGSFRKIRNEFAHRAFTASYQDLKIQRLFEPLVIQLEKFAGTAVRAADGVGGCRLRRIGDLSVSERYLASIALLAGTVFQELLVLPESQRHHISPNDLFKRRPAETVIGKVQRTMIRVVLESFSVRVV